MSNVQTEINSALLFLIKADISFLRMIYLIINPFSCVCSLFRLPQDSILGDGQHCGQCSAAFLSDIRCNRVSRQTKGWAFFGRREN